MITSRHPRAGRLLAALAVIAAAAGCSSGEAGNQVAAPEQTEREQVAASADDGDRLRRPRRAEQKLVPPGAVLGPDPEPSTPALVFQSPEEPARLLGWLRATANGADFMLETEMQEGAEHVLSGRVRTTNDVFTVRIAPGATGGTTGIAMVAAR